MSHFRIKPLTRAELAAELEKTHAELEAKRARKRDAMRRYRAKLALAQQEQSQ